MRRQKTCVRGSYLLEAAIVTFGLAVFLVGASDVARIFHARSALRAGVREGLRCLYPTDGGCALPEADHGTPGVSRYSVDVWDNLSLYAVPRNAYSAQASWVTEPELVTPLESQRISEATLDLARDRFRRQTVLFPVQGNHPYLLQTRDFPVISGSDPLNPLFRDHATHQEEQPHKVLDISSIAGVARGPMSGQPTGFEPRFRIGTASFSLRDAWPSWPEDGARIARIEGEHDIQVRCYVGEVVRTSSRPKLDWPATEAPSRCSYRGGASLYSGGGLKVPVMFRLSGATRGTAAGAQGKVLLSLRWERGREGDSQQLGGRLLSAGGSGNFVVRGATLDDIAERYRAPYIGDAAYSEEIRSHGTIIPIPVDARVYLDLFLVSLNGRQVSWQGHKVELFYPAFSFVEEAFGCEYSASPTACKGEVPVAPLYTTLDLTRGLKSEPAALSQCARERPAVYQEDPEAYLLALRSALSAGRAPRPEAFWAKESGGSERCAPLRKHISCDAKAREYLKGCGVCDVPLVRALPQGCADAAFDPKRDVVSALACQRANAGRVDRRRGCSGEALPACAAKHAAASERFLLEGGDGECSMAQTQSPPALLSDPMPISTCGDEPPIAAQYRERYGVPEGIAIPVTTIIAPEELRQSPPPGQCTAYREVTRPGDRRSCGALLTGEAAARCCAGQQGRCSITPVLLRPGSSGDGGQDLLIDKARERALATIEAAYPPSRRAANCQAGAENCVAVTADHRAEADQVSMRAEAAVPLRLASIVGHDQVILSHTESRVLERRFLRD